MKSDDVTPHDLLVLTKDIVASAVRKDDFVVPPKKIAEMIEEVYGSLKKVYEDEATRYL
ncbi:hypothetical protein [Chitinivibrio alkaliphilus]|uniref:Uncharacterized protein n=1 Tax=Chitinivibrio alkaliphilus ACht1 TaxID=1313304 RepID=U7D6C0_9BACT|nr:hypothetical protein [Chitinivibrio alkaliphilus]ERP32064.1 hypothetical protein CALK_1049 [Chitinivibrio alkaliphilus ACht1]